MGQESASGAPRADDSLLRNEERFRLLVESVQDYAIFMLDVHGHVASWNRGAERLKGWQADEIIGRSFTNFYPPEAVALGWPQEELRRAEAIGRFEDEGWRVRKDGTRFWANVVITALRTPDGALAGFAKVTRDLSERKRQEEALRQSEEQFRLLIEGVRDYAIFMLDPEGTVRTWNAGAAAMTGYAAAEVIGRHFSMFFRPEDVAAGKPALELEVGLREGRFQDQGWRVRKDGRLFWAYVTLTPLFDAHGELRGYAKVTRDLTESRRLVELEQSSRRMNEFLAMLAHELRNPLAPISNAVTLMRLQPEMDEPLRRGAQIIERQVGHLARLVDDLLDVGRIATGKILLRSEPLDWSEVVNASVDAARPLAAARGHTLTLAMPARPLPLMGDATRLAQALQNLLNNAVRYTPEGGRIDVAVRVDDGACVTTVSDTGRGIPAHALERIFDLFVQEEAGQAHPEGGLGIGLSLARTLVELHGGRLSAASDGPGCGSTFTMHLPLSEARPSAPQEAPEIAVVPRAAPAPCRALVVDDNRDSADTMVSVLKLLGCQAQAAYGGVQALRVAEQFRPRMVLLDLNMPDVNGFTVLRHLQERATLGRMVVVAMTGYGQASDRQNTLEAGFDAHLTKPVDIAQLTALVAQAQALGD